MIFVNYRGGGYYFFKHARWNGKFFCVCFILAWFIKIYSSSMHGNLARTPPEKSGPPYQSARISLGELLYRLPWILLLLPPSYPRHRSPGAKQHVPLGPGGAN